MKRQLLQHARLTTHPICQTLDAFVDKTRKNSKLDHPFLHSKGRFLVFFTVTDAKYFMTS